MANLSKTTQDHEEIRRWAEERGGKPSHVKSTGSGEDVGILRIDFPGYSGEGSLEPVSWEQFFDKFDERNLAFLYEEETAGGQRSNFNKMVSAETAAEAGRSSHRRRGGAKTSAGGSARATKKSATKKAGAKSAAKKAPAKKAAAKKAPAKKSAVKKAAVKKAATKKSGARKSIVRRTGAAKKTARTSSAKRAPAKKAPAKKSAAKSTLRRR
jgi:hypothetical protein